MPFLLIPMSINIYDQGYWEHLWTGVLAYAGFILAACVVVWFFGSKND